MHIHSKIHYSHRILDNGISSFRYSDSNNSDRIHDRHYLYKSSSHSLTDPNHQLQNNGSHLDTIIETEIIEQPPFIKRILLVDDDADVTLTFKAGLDGRYYGDRKRFDVYTYNNPILVVKEFNPWFLLINRDSLCDVLRSDKSEKYSCNA